MFSIYQQDNEEYKLIWEERRFIEQPDCSSLTNGAKDLVTIGNHFIT